MNTLNFAKLILPSPIVDLAVVLKNKNSASYSRISKETKNKLIFAQVKRIIVYSASLFATIGTAGLTFASTGDVDAALLAGLITKSILIIPTAYLCETKGIISRKFGDGLEMLSINTIALGIFCGDYGLISIGALERGISLICFGQSYK